MNTKRKRSFYEPDPILQLCDVKLPTGFKVADTVVDEDEDSDFTRFECIQANCLLIGATVIIGFSLFTIGSRILYSIMVFTHTLYTNLREGKMHFRCVVGGSSIEIAECQLIHGINLSIHYVITNFLEFSSNIFNSKNIFNWASGAISMLSLIHFTFLKMNHVGYLFHTAVELWKKCKRVVLMVLSSQRRKETHSTNNKKKKRRKSQQLD